MVYERQSLPNLDMQSTDRKHGNTQDAMSISTSPKSKYSIRSVSFDSRLPYPRWEHFHQSTNNPSPTSSASCLTHIEQLATATTATGGSTVDRPSLRKTPSATISLEEEDVSNYLLNPELVSNCKEAALILRDTLKLTLFGFDVIVPDNELIDVQSRIVIIDVNFFPSYKEVKDFPTKLNNFLRKKAKLPVWDNNSTGAIGCK